MANQLTSNASSIQPVVRAITLAGVKDALARGLDDFWAMPTHLIFLSMIYPVLGLSLGRIALGYGLYHCSSHSRRDSLWLARSLR